MHRYCVGNCSISAYVWFGQMFITPVNVSLNPYTNRFQSHPFKVTSILTETSRYSLKGPETLSPCHGLASTAASHSLDTHILLHSKSAGFPSKKPRLPPPEDHTITKTTVSGISVKPLQRLSLCLSWECHLHHFPPAWGVKFPHLSRDHYFQLAQLCPGFQENRTAV